MTTDAAGGVWTCSLDLAEALRARGFEVHLACLVLSDLETLREIWGEAALFMPPGDSAAWREALNGLARDRGRLRALARAASQRARELTADRRAGASEELYRSLEDLERRPALPRSARTE